MSKATRRAAAQGSLLLLLVLGCGKSGAPEQQRAATGAAASGHPAIPATLAPATYVGRLPCADCPGIELTVTLFANQAFRLRRVYLERPGVFCDMGNWSLEANGTRLALRGGTDGRQLFAIVGKDSLRVLDRLGQPIHSPSSLALSRASQIDPVGDSMSLTGTYRFMADAGRTWEVTGDSLLLAGPAGQRTRFVAVYLR